MSIILKDKLREYDYIDHLYKYMKREKNAYNIMKQNVKFVDFILTFIYKKFKKHYTKTFLYLIHHFHQMII